MHQDVRGRALGGWNFAIGWGWLGPLSLGALADATSVPAALTLSGNAARGLRVRRTRRIRYAAHPLSSGGHGVGQGRRRG